MGNPLKPSELHFLSAKWGHFVFLTSCGGCENQMAQKQWFLRTVPSGPEFIPVLDGIVVNFVFVKFSSEFSNKMCIFLPRTEKNNLCPFLNHLIQSPQRPWDGCSFLHFRREAIRKKRSDSWELLRKQGSPVLFDRQISTHITPWRANSPLWEGSGGFVVFVCFFR